MKQDLRNLVTAEELFFSDSVRYTTTIGSGGLDYHLSSGPGGPDRLLELRLTKDGWAATIGTTGTATTCTAFVGSTVVAPAVKEGEPVCIPHGP
jgi:hypothetical protein